jgi:hypothetical protein
MKIQILSMIGSIMFLLFIFRLIIKEKIREAYSLLWLFMGVIFLVLSIWRNLLDNFGLMVGIAYPPIAVLLVMIMCVILILIQFSVVVSIQTDKIKSLSQEIGLLNLKIKELEQDNIAVIRNDRIE